MEVMHSSHQRSVAAAEQAMPRILETERRYVSSPETARRAGSGGAVVFRPESALSRSRYSVFIAAACHLVCLVTCWSRRPSSRLAELDVDGGGDGADETGLAVPAAPHQRDNDSDDEEERRELDERLNTLRLDLAGELQVFAPCP